MSFFRFLIFIPIQITYIKGLELIHIDKVGTESKA